MCSWRSMDGQRESEQANRRTSTHAHTHTHAIGPAPCYFLHRGWTLPRASKSIGYRGEEDKLERAARNLYWPGTVARPARRTFASAALRRKNRQTRTIMRMNCPVSEERASSGSSSSGGECSVAARAARALPHSHSLSGARTNVRHTVPRMSACLRLARTT